GAVEIALHLRLERARGPRRRAKRGVADLVPHAAELLPAQDGVFRLLAAVVLDERIDLALHRLGRLPLAGAEIAVLELLHRPNDVGQLHAAGVGDRLVNGRVHRVIAVDDLLDALQRLLWVPRRRRRQRVLERRIFVEHVAQALALLARARGQLAHLRLCRLRPFAFALDDVLERPGAHPRRSPLDRASPGPQRTAERGAFERIARRSGLAAALDPALESACPGAREQRTRHPPQDGGDELAGATGQDGGDDATGGRIVTQFTRQPLRRLRQRRVDVLRRAHECGAGGQADLPQRRH